MNMDMDRYKELVKSELDRLKARYKTIYMISKELSCYYCICHTWYKKYYVQPEFALKVERMTKGDFRRYNLCPSIFNPIEYGKIWPAICIVNKYPRTD